MSLTKLQLVQFYTDYQVLENQVGNQDPDYWTTVQEIREYLPTFAPDVKQEFGLDSQQYQDLLNYLGRCSEAARDGKVQPKIALNASIEPVQIQYNGGTTSAINDPSQATILMAQLGSHTDAITILKALSSVTREWTGKRLGSALVAITQQLSVIDATIPLGDAEPISAVDLMAWKARNNKACRVVGPYILMKLLVQLNVFFKVYDFEGVRWIEWERNGVKVTSSNRRILQSTSEKELSEDDWTTFLSGLEIDRKTIRFEDISIHAYNAIDLLSTIYKISKDSVSNKLTFFLSNSSLVVPPDVAKFLDSLQIELNREVCHWNNVDDQIEMMAQKAQRLGVPEVVTKFIYSNMMRIGNVVDGIRKALQPIEALKTTGEKEAELSAIGAQSSLGAAILRLKGDREKVRNTSNITQYVEKNVGSISASGLPQALDTALKGKHIIELMRQMGKFIQDQKAVLHVYGVAYGHMEKVLNVACKVMYYDTKAAGKSAANMANGNIWSCNGDYILDDSNPSQIEDVNLVGLAGKHYTVSHAKIARVIGNCGKFAVVKLNMEHFVLDEQQTMLCNMVYNSKFKYAQLVKFGKLHNAEAFMVLSVDHVRPPALASDFKVVAQCISVANMIITQAANRGVRINQDKKNGVFLNDCWAQLIRSLPVRWGWYLKPIKKGDVMGGAHFARLVVQNDTNTYDAGFAFDFN